MTLLQKLVLFIAAVCLVPSLLQLPVTTTARGYDGWGLGESVMIVCQPSRRKNIFSLQARKAMGFSLPVVTFVICVVVRDYYFPLLLCHR